MNPGAISNLTLHMQVKIAICPWRFPAWKPYG